MSEREGGKEERGCEPHLRPNVMPPTASSRLTCLQEHDGSRQAQLLVVHPELSDGLAEVKDGVHEPALDLLSGPEGFDGQHVALEENALRGQVKATAHPHESYAKT